MPTPPLHESGWLFGISDNPMSAYDADGTNPTSLIKLVTMSQELADYSPAIANNEGQSTGQDWATEQWIESHDVEVPFSIQPSANMLGRLLYAAFGSVVSNLVSTSLAYEHVFTPMTAATSRQLPAYWGTERNASIHDALYPSLVLERLTLNGQGLGRLEASGSFRGSGKQILDQNITINPETGKKYFRNTQSEIVRAEAATPETPVKTYACGLESWSFDVDNAHDPNIGYDKGCKRFYTTADPESGVIRSYHLFGRRKYQGDFVIKLEDSSPELTILRNQDPIHLQVEVVGSNIEETFDHTLTIEMHLAHYRAVALGSQDGYVTLQITPDAFYDESANKIVTVTLVNTEVSYTA